MIFIDHSGRLGYDKNIPQIIGLRITSKAVRLIFELLMLTPLTMLLHFY